VLAFNREGGGGIGAALRSTFGGVSGLGEIDEWPPALRSIVNLMLNSGFPMFVAWGQDLTFIYNDAYAPILGTKHPAALGRPFQEVWSEIWDDIGPLAARALAGEAIWQDDLPLVMERNGYPENTWFTFSYSPALDDEGNVAGVFCACTETTEKVLAVRSISEERQRLSQLFGEAPAFMALLNGPDHVFELANDAYYQVVGHREILGKPVRDALPEVVGQGFVELLDNVYATGKSFVGRQMPIQLQRKENDSTEQAFVDFIYQPIVDENEQVTGIFATGYDVTEVKRAEERLRIAQEAGGIGSFELLPITRMIEVSEEFCRIWGIPFSPVLPLDETLKSIHPDDIPNVLTGRQSITAETLGYVEYRIIRPDNGELRWIARRGEAIADAHHEVMRFAGVIYDITDRRNAEEALASQAKHQRLLINELNHRVKNTLAIVQSLAHQTFKGEASLSGARRDFEARLTSLAGAHNLLTQKNWEQASLKDAVRASVTATAGTSAQRVTIEGPEILLDPQMAVTLTMAIHELSTNALKYGALSNDTGKVTVQWKTIDHPGSCSRMHFSWTESGGPAVEAPLKRGFGSRLIERGIASELRGNVKLIFEPGGIVCTIDAPLPQGESNV
jgi:PAS domain S-box-containing protein